MEDIFCTTEQIILGINIDSFTSTRFIFQTLPME